MKGSGTLKLKQEHVTGDCISSRVNAMYSLCDVTAEQWISNGLGVAMIVVFFRFKWDSVHSNWRLVIQASELSLSYTISADRQGLTREDNCDKSDTSDLYTRFRDRDHVNEY